MSTSPAHRVENDIPALVPARMLNEFAYCPRLFFIEWVDGEFADNYYTVHGRSVHQRSDEPSGYLPNPDDLDDNDPLRKLRSVLLSSDDEGLIARIDVLEVEGGAVEPVELKRGKPAPTPERVWEPERVQLAAQALILRANGYRCERGWVYFKGTKERIEVPVDDTLVQRVRDLRSELRAVAASGQMPPPLVNSRKCDGCSLVSICLPDELNVLNDVGPGGAVRRLIPPREDALPLYVSGHGQRVSLSSGTLSVVDKDGSKVCDARLEHTSQVSLYGSVQISTPALRELCDREIPVFFFSYGGWFCGRTEGVGHKNVELRRAQFTAASSELRSLAIARVLVESKILNCRTLLRRNHTAAPKAVLRSLKDFATAAAAASEVGSLLGIEGSAARAYFGAFTGMLKQGDGDERWSFDMNGRTRRPPRDPINALLSFCYALLVKDCTHAVVSAGFDPYLGFYHRPRYGRPALALDLMEEFRPLIAESVVLAVVNNGVVTGGDFLRSGQGVALLAEARKRVVAAYERRMDELVTHPVFGYRISYRRVLAVQARLLGRYLQGEVHEAPRFRTR